MSGGSTGDAWEIVPRTSFDDEAGWVELGRRGCPRKDLPGHIEHAIGALAFWILANWYRVSGAAIRTVEPAGVKSIAPGKIPPVGATRRFFPLGLTGPAGGVSNVDIDGNNTI